MPDSRPRPLKPVLLLALAGALGAQAPLPPPIISKPRPSVDLYPAYSPVTGTAAQRLVKEARWIRNQVWATGPVGDAATFLIPRSYDVTSGYGFLGTDYFSWMLNNNDSYYQFDATHNDHRLDVPADHSNDAALERVMMAGGSNLYDTATWALALSAARACGVFTKEEKADFAGALNAYFRFLISSSYPGGFQTYKAYDLAGAQRWGYGESGQDAAYGVDGQGKPLDYRNAYYWQYAAPRWQNPDPHWDPLGTPSALMNWPSWSAITGEEAWGAFLGPLQAAFTQNGGKPGWSWSSTPTNAVDLVGNAARALHAVALMQNTVTGGLYRNVRPPNSPDSPQWSATSVENNWSMYTGLGFLERALEDLKATLPAYPQVLDFDLDGSLAALRNVRQGMVKFFLNGALVWHAKGDPFGDPAAVPFGFFLQGTEGAAGSAAGVTGAFATDVQTWGIAAILGDRALEKALESTYGKDFLFDMFRSAIGLGGYAPGGALAGIGYSGQKAGDPGAQMSGEWTWGAINAAMVLADFYGEPAHADPARARELLGWARTMIDGVDRHCSHDYNPQHLENGQDWAGYLYANRRQWIPWGWFSNACPSQASTTWAFMVNCAFNPFELGGGEHQATARILGLAGR